MCVYYSDKGMIDENWREEYMKPGFEDFKSFAKTKPSVDVDLDGEIYADQLHSLLQRISPENLKPKPFVDETGNNRKIEVNKKPTDEEIIFDKIHGIDENKMAEQLPAMKKFGDAQPRVRIPHHGGAFEGFVDGPKTHRQTFSYQMIRKPGGSYSTSTVVDPEGNTKTIIKRTVDGETKTQTLVNGVDIAGNGQTFDSIEKSNDWIIDSGRYLRVNKDGYALPKNLW